MERLARDKNFTSLDQIVNYEEIGIL